MSCTDGVFVEPHQTPGRCASSTAAERRRGECARRWRAAARACAVPLCADEPFDIREPELDGLQRHVRGARGSDPMRHMDAQRVDIAQRSPALLPRTSRTSDSIAGDRADRSRRERARPPARHRAIAPPHDSQPCGQAPISSALLRRRRPARPLRGSIARPRAVSAITASAPVRRPASETPRDRRGPMPLHRRTRQVCSASFSCARSVCARPRYTMPRSWTLRRRVRC